MGSQRVGHEWETFTFTIFAYVGVGNDKAKGQWHSPLQYSCLENPMDRGAWQATDHSVAKSWTWLKQLSMHMYSLYTYIFVKVKVTQSWLTLCDPMDYTVLGILQAGILEWVAFPFSWDLPNPGINPGLPHCRHILYQLSHKGSPRILEWVAYPFSRRSSQPRNRTRVSCITGGFFTNWAIREVN